jgi:two-component system, chemotaxis family, chemotaxis protein CheY
VEPNATEAIVIVDDEMSFTTMLGRLLQEYFACPIYTFGNPLTALESIQRLKVGIVVTDYYMPHIDGIELINRLYALNPASTPPCLLITGHAMDENSAIHTLPCYKGMISKPFRWQQLATRIVKHWPKEVPLPVHPGATLF